jgi:hypothetical protein
MWLTVAGRRTFGIPSGCWLITVFVGGSAGVLKRSVGILTSLSESLELTARALHVLHGLELVVLEIRALSL